MGLISSALMFLLLGFFGGVGVGLARRFKLLGG